jgi:predicted nucleotidyltransferase
MTQHPKQTTKQQIKDIIFQYLPSEFKVYLFGSRATGTEQKFSDYDIGILGAKALDPVIKADIEEALEQSDIPYIVEIVDLNTVSERFKKIALENGILWTPNKK